MSFLDDIGGAAVVDRLAEHFYRRALADPDLRVLFRDPDEPHAKRMAWFLTELFGGERVHSRHRGGFATMVAAHRGLRISEAQRIGWVDHLLAAADEVGIPDGPLRQFANYVDTASRLALNGSQ